MHRVLRGAIIGRHSMASLMVRCQPLFVVCHHMALLLCSHYNLNGSFLDLCHSDRLQIPPRCQQSCFIQQVFQVRAGKTRRRLGNRFEFNVWRKRLSACMNLEDFLTALNVGIADHHLAVKTAGAHQSGVQNIRAVCRCNHNYAFVRAKTVHFHQQLVQCLLALIVAAAQSCAALTAYRINLIDKNDTGRVLLRLFKQIAYTGCTDADKHLHEIGTRYGEKRHPRFPCNRAGQQGFTSTRRAHQQDTFRNSCAEFVVLFRVL